MIDTGSRLPVELKNRLDDELSFGENILWTGQPTRSRMAVQSLGIFLFGIPWTLFACFWTWGASGGLAAGHGSSHSSAPFWIFGLFGVPFILVGLGMLTSPLWLIRKAASTVYAITDKRVIFLDGGGFMGAMTVRSLKPDEVAGRIRTQKIDGSGDLVFPRTASLINSYQSNYQSNRSTVVQVGFYGIPDVKKVDDLIDTTFAPRPRGDMDGGQPATF